VTSARIAIVWAPFALAACGGAAPAASAPSEAPTEAPAHARVASVHRSKCGSCHVRVEPGERTRVDLEAALARHRKRVRLTEEEWGDMVDYLAKP
jgi:hypothetical protein